MINAINRLAAALEEQNLRAKRKSIEKTILWKELANAVEVARKCRKRIYNLGLIIDGSN